MHRRALCWGLTLLSAAWLTSPAGAQDAFADAERVGRDFAFEQRPPFGGLSETTWLTGQWSVNAFYAVFRGEYPNQSTHWVIRRVEGGRGGGATVLWADSRSCSAVEQVLIAMERLPIVRPDAPKLGEEAANFGVVMDGTHYIFWNRYARSGQNNAKVGLEISGNLNSPVAAWWAGSVGNLANCWHEMPPL